MEPPPRQSDAMPAAPEVMLEDKVPAALKLSRRFAGTVAAFGVIYAWFVLKPLWHTDLWGHLAYGRYLWTHAALPSTEPLMPLSRGMTFVDTAWLTQLIGFLTVDRLGVAGLQGLVALTVTATAAFVYQRLLSRTRSVGLAALGVALFLWFDWSNLLVARPQLAGLLCFSVLLNRVMSRRPTTWDWVLVPLTLGLWANLHGSFVIGLAVLGVFLVGRVIDVLRRTGTWRAVGRDADARRYLLWLQLSLMATLVNPYGLGLYADVLTTSAMPNLQDLTEWQPLHVRTPHGLTFLAAGLGLALLYRLTPRRVQSWEVLLLSGLAFGTLWSARFGVWWGPVAAMLLTIHLHATLRRWLPWRAETVLSPVNGKWSVVAVGLLWIFFAYSPLGMRLLHAKEPALDKAVSASTPLGVTKWLNEHPPRGLVFNPFEWGDYLLWAGPSDMQLFLNSHAHLVPRDVWLHYLQVMQQSADWEAILNRYGVNTVILDKEFREGLIRRLRDNAEWSIGYEDKTGVVFVRRKPV